MKKKKSMYPNIEAERARTQMTTEDIAEMIGVTRKSYETWNSRGNIPATALIKMSKIWGCTTDYLLGLSEIRK